MQNPKFNQIILSSFLHLTNEEELFEIILNKIKEDSLNISLIKYIYFGLVYYNSFIQISSSLQFSSITNEFFELCKEVFYSTFLNFKEEFTQQILSFSSLIENFDIIEHNYYELYYLLNITIDSSLSDNILLIEHVNENKLKFTDKEKSFIFDQKAKYIILFNIYFEDCENDIDYFSDDTLFISIPILVTSLGNCCFQECSSLTQISLPNSITSLGYRCFSKCSSLTQISLPNSIISLGHNCFCECKNLIEINCPPSLNNINDEIFFGCSSLQNKQFWEKKCFDQYSF
jgi:hypothetical protein